MSDKDLFLVEISDMLDEVEADGVAKAYTRARDIARSALAAGVGQTVEEQRVTLLGAISYLAHSDWCP